MQNQCQICQSLKVKYNCELCKQEICKSCTKFLEPELWHLFQRRGVDTECLIYCLSCYNNDIEPKVSNYNQLVEQAKEMPVFFKKQNKETYWLSRKEKAIQITDALDQADVVLQLAIASISKGFNCVIDIVVQEKKIRNGSYQTTRWSGHGIPCHLKQDQLVKDRSHWQNPN